MFVKVVRLCCIVTLKKKSTHLKLLTQDISFPLRSSSANVGKEYRKTQINTKEASKMAFTRAE